MNQFFSALGTVYIIGLIAFWWTGHDVSHTMLWPLTAYQNVAAAH